MVTLPWVTAASRSVQSDSIKATWSCAAASFCPVAHGSSERVGRRGASRRVSTSRGSPARINGSNRALPVRGADVAAALNAHTARPAPAVAVATPAARATPRRGPNCRANAGTVAAPAMATGSAGCSSFVEADAPVAASAVQCRGADAASGSSDLAGSNSARAPVPTRSSWSSAAGNRARRCPVVVAGAAVGCCRNHRAHAVPSSSRRNGVDGSSSVRCSMRCPEAACCSTPSSQCGSNAISGSTHAPPRNEGSGSWHSHSSQGSTRRACSTCGSAAACCDHASRRAPSGPKAALLTAYSAMPAARLHCSWPSPLSRAATTRAHSRCHASATGIGTVGWAASALSSAVGRAGSGASLSAAANSVPSASGDVAASASLSRASTRASSEGSSGQRRNRRVSAGDSGTSVVSLP